VPAIIVALTLWIGMKHFKNGVRVLIEDYVHGFARELWIIATVILSYAIAATGVFAVLKMAL
jgi:succinate dehydrogenase / fumarate reductase membrane anchor subunit